MNALVEIANDPYRYTHWLEKAQIWTAIKVITQDDYELPNNLATYYEHPIDLGMREPLKAAFERKLIFDVSRLCGFRIKPNRFDPYAHGHDGDLKIDTERLRRPTAPLGTQGAERQQFDYLGMPFD